MYVLFYAYRAVMAMTPTPDDSSDDPPKARYFKNLRVLDVIWLVTLNKPLTIKGFKYQQGAMMVYGTYW